MGGLRRDLRVTVMEGSEPGIVDEPLPGEEAEEGLVGGRKGLGLRGRMYWISLAMLAWERMET
jgi:hypothetical protein